MKAEHYDRIGVSYAERRVADPRIAALLWREVAGATEIVNVGAGAGSYEPHWGNVIAVEPSRVMIAQRAHEAGPVVQARAEALPFPARQFDCAMAILTIHHWAGVEQGLREMLRVARRKVVVLTWIGFVKPFWLVDYLPEVESIDARIFPSLEALSSWLGPTRVTPVPIPHDCTDGFLCAYWRRPEAYLCEGVRAGMSTFSRLQNTDEALDRLRGDLVSGRWKKRYGRLLAESEIDMGYRLVVVERT